MYYVYCISTLSTCEVKLSPKEVVDNPSTDNNSFVGWVTVRTLINNDIVDFDTFNCTHKSEGFVY